MTEASADRRIPRVLPNANRPLPAQTTVDAVPRFRWPSERWQVPTRCHREHCRSRLIEIDPPTPEGALGEARCLTCSRVLAELVHDGYTRMTPQRFAALPTQQGRRQPPPAPAATARPHAKGCRPCPECGRRRIACDRARCIDCRERVSWERSHAARLVALLADGRPRHRTDLAGLLGISTDGLRQVVRKARLAGYAICTTHAGGHYALEGVPS